MNHSYTEKTVSNLLIWLKIRDGFQSVGIVNAQSYEPAEPFLELCVAQDWLIAIVVNLEVYLSDVLSANDI